MGPNGEGNELGRSSWCLVRDADGTYRCCRIWDESDPLTHAQCGLRGAGAIGPAAWTDRAALKEKP